MREINIIKTSEMVSKTDAKSFFAENQQQAICIGFENNISRFTQIVDLLTKTQKQRGNLVILIKTNLSQIVMIHDTNDFLFSEFLTEE